jgi:hypothetical protein
MSAWQDTLSQGINMGLSLESQQNTHRLACTINTVDLILAKDITLICPLLVKHF